jgi:hypothetical protein
MLEKEKNRQYLTEIIKLFVVKKKQARFLEFIQSAKRFDDFIDELFIDPRSLKPECLVEIPSNQKSPEIVLNRLQNLGAGKPAYVLSVSGEQNGKYGNLQEIVFSGVGQSVGTIIYCVGSRLGYYEDGEMFQFILKA